MQLIKLNKLDDLEKNLENVSVAVRAAKYEIDVVRRQENHNLIIKVANLETEVIELKADKNGQVDKLEKRIINVQPRSACEKILCRTTSKKRSQLRRKILQKLWKLTLVRLIKVMIFNDPMKQKKTI